MGASVQWTSSLDGTLGNGDTLALPADGLSEGVHVITVTRYRQSGTDQQRLGHRIYVLSQPPPTLAIQNANNQVLLSWPANVDQLFTGSQHQLDASLLVYGYKRAGRCRHYPNRHIESRPKQTDSSDCDCLNVKPVSSLNHFTHE